MKYLRLSVAALLLGLLAAACADADTPESAQSACAALCDKIGKNNCVEREGGKLDRATCQARICAAAPKTLPIGCNSAQVEWFHCLAAQDDVCLWDPEKAVTMTEPAAVCPNENTLAQTHCFQ